MTTKNILTISALSLCGLSLCFTNFTPVGDSSSKQVLQADSPMPPPVPIKKPGGTLRNLAAAPVTLEIADSPMPPPVPIKKPGGALRNLAATPGTLQIADSPMPPPVPIKKPGGATVV